MTRTEPVNEKGPAAVDGTGENRSTPTSYPQSPAAQRRPDSPSWTQAKRHGDDAEIRVAEWFKARGFSAFRSIGNADVDVMLQAGIEIKRDLLTPKTGNVAIETHYRGKPSGISTSTATYWAIVVESTAFIVQTLELRKLAASGRFRSVAAGDGGRAIVQLIPLDVIRAMPNVRPVELGGAP